MSDDNRVIIFDTTLRDGEQSPGATMTLEEKLEVAELLDAMGVDVIEAGFPVASPGDFEAVSEVAKLVKNASVAGLARANERDIEVAAQAVKHCEKPRIHTFISTSPVHMKYKLRKEPEQVVEMISDSVRFARKFVDDVEWSAEDATRTERDFLCRCVETAIKAGATTINIPDTVGYSVPEEFAEIIRMLKERVPGADKVIFSTHCHNDLGLAVANSLAGVKAGARQIECTINGIGERAGNAALEEVVMAMRVRNDVLPFTTNIDTTMLTRASKLVSAVTSFPVPYNKAIVGRNAFAHESGIHQDGVLKHTQTYEIMRPEDVGAGKSVLVMGKHSGRHAFREKLKELGYELSDNAFEDAFQRFKELADRKKHVFDEDIEALVDENIAFATERRKVIALKMVTDTEGSHRATLTVDDDGQMQTVEATSNNGPVDAIFQAIKKAAAYEARLKEYHVHAITEGTDAQAEVTVHLRDEEEGFEATGRAYDPDTLLASAKAYMLALNRLEARKKRVSAQKGEMEPLPEPIRHSGP